MLDIKRIRQNPDELITAMAHRRNKGVDVQAFLAKETRRREIIAAVESKKAERNTASAAIGAKRKRGEDASAETEQTRLLGAEIKELDAELAVLSEEVETQLAAIPNIPHSSVPVGGSDEDNVEIRRWGQPRAFAFTPLPHWDIGEGLGILDFAAGAKIAGSRFTVSRGLGARLERAVIAYFLDTHTANGYTEILPPYIVNSASMFGTGQLPKFDGGAFKLLDTDYFLSPTAEVQVTNLLRDEILESGTLPLAYCAYSACFRAEAGSAGRDTRGIIRQHQFNKVELVRFTEPEQSYAALEDLTRDAEKVLQGLGLPYRVVALSTGDIGFASAKTYDIEVWMPSYGRYVEISSCSNFEDFQARRAQIRYRPAPGAKPALVHTLNGSGVAVGRTVAAILENYQREDGTVEVPEALQRFMGTEIISNKE